MVLESAQLLCSAFPDGDAPYKRTHYNHPCAIWIRESVGNYVWLLSHSYALLEEYNRRYGKVHKSKSVIDYCYDNFRSKVIFKQKQATDFVQCMPEQYKIPNDAVQAYRNYYKGEKAKFAKWKLGEPKWWAEGI